MDVLVYLPLLVPALAAATARPLAARLEPLLATWLLTAVTVALAVFSTAALALLAASALARVPALAALGGYSRPALHRGDPVPVHTGVAAALLLTAAAVAVAVVIRARARGLAEAYRRAALMAPDGPVVIVPGQAIEAYALPGAPGRIVVSGRLLDALDDRGRAALLAHEQAHLAARHHLFTTVAHLAAAANPLLLPVARAVDYTVERWADERAATATGDRRLVAATIGRVALLTPGRPRRTRAAALAITGTRAPAGTRGGAGNHGRRISLAWAGPVPRRVAALLAPPPGRQLALLAVATVLVVIAGVSAAEAARDLHALVEFAQSAR
ncbi:MAG TPA: M48 family metalloprotease [Streptosporangiaceae bacterium]|nr:M48 family metalloprotease [Streptosporangiaceae bacterium]